MLYYQDAIRDREKKMATTNGHPCSPKPNLPIQTWIAQPTSAQSKSIHAQSKSVHAQSNTGKDVEAEELLLCEKAFSAVFAKEESSELEGDDKDEETLGLRAKLATIRNPSLQGGFGEPFPWAGCGGGEEWEREGCCR